MKFLCIGIKDVITADLYCGWRLSLFDSGYRLYLEAVFGTECMGRENHLRAERGVLDYFLELTVQLSSAGHSVVIDHGFWSKAELKRATDYFDAHGIAYTVVETEADFETRLARVVNRTNGKRFDKEKLLRFDSYYEE